MDPCDWMEYSVDPRKVRNLPAIYGNNLVMFRCDLTRVMADGLVSSVIRASADPPVDRDILLAVYDVDTGQKYPLSIDYAQDGRVLFRPDQHIWRLEYEDFTLEARAFAPPGRFAYCVTLKLEASKRLRLRLFREIIGFGDSRPGGLGAEKAWVDEDVAVCQLRLGAAMASGSNLTQGKFSISKMFSGFVYDIAEQYEGIDLEPGRPVEFSFARSIAADPLKAREEVAHVLADPSARLAETTDYWNAFLRDIPQVRCSDEEFVKAHNWMWANFRINQWNVEDDALPDGQWGVNFSGYIHDQVIGPVDSMESAAALVYWAPGPVRDFVRIIWSTQGEDGQLPGVDGVFFDGRAEDEDNPPRFGGPSLMVQLAKKYVEFTGDEEFLSEHLEGVPLIERLEKGLRWYDDNRLHEDLGLYWTLGGGVAWGDLSEKYRGYRTYYCDQNAFLVGAMEDLAFLERILGRSEKAESYSRKAQTLADRVNSLMWNDDLGMYVDVDSDGQQRLHKHAFSFITGFAASCFMNGTSGLADDAKARSLVRNLESSSFDRPHGFPSLAWDHPYYDPDNDKYSGLGWHNQQHVVRGLYYAVQTEMAHHMLKKLVRLNSRNEGLGPRYMAEAYNAETGEMYAGGRFLPQARSFNYPANFNLILGLYEGVFGLKVSRGVEVNVNSPWEEASLSGLKLFGHEVSVSWSEAKGLTLSVDGEDVVRISPEAKAYHRLETVSRR